MSWLERVRAMFRRPLRKELDQLQIAIEQNERRDEEAIRRMEAKKAQAKAAVAEVLDQRAAIIARRTTNDQA
jgi:hypothetical protein